MSAPQARLVALLFLAGALLGGLWWAVGRGSAGAPLAARGEARSEQSEGRVQPTPAAEQLGRRRPEAGWPPQAPESSAEATEQGSEPGHSLRGTVRDDLGVGVEGVSVELHRPSEVALLATSDALGAFSFEGLAAGVYLVRMDPKSIPPPYLPSPGRERAAPGEFPDWLPGTFVPRISVPTEGEVELRVLSRGGVQGRALLPDGRPLAGADISMQYVASGVDAVVAEAETGDDGCFGFPVIWAGEYFATLEAYHPELEALANPLPLRFEVTRGAMTTLPDLVLGGGPVTLAGRVVDQRGEPFEGLVVEGFYLYRGDRNSPRTNSALAITDANGAYRMEGFAPRPVRVCVGRFGRPDASGKKVRPRVVVQPVVVELEDREGVVELEATVAERGSGRYRLEGRFLLDPAWAASNGVTLEGCELRFALAPRDSRVRAPYVGPDGAFFWECVTPQEPLSLVVSVVGAEVEIEPFRIVPVPGAVDSLAIEVP